MKLTTKKITQNAVIAALYFVLTLISSPLSFGLIQFRISEFLMLLCFFRKDYVIGVTVGCFLSNLAMSATILGAGGWIDLLIGTAATLISGLIMPYTKRLFLFVSNVIISQFSKYAVAHPKIKSTSPIILQL